MNSKDFIVVIPARLGSTRIRHKPLLDIHGLPLVIHVCRRVSQFVSKNRIFVATEADEVVDVCASYGYQAVVTSPNHSHPLDRVCEVALEIQASSAYLVVNGDEPFFSEDTIPKLLEDYESDSNFFVSNAASRIVDVSDALDPANIKIVVNSQNYAIYCSRAPIPQPFGDLDIVYRKFVGIGMFSHEALRFFNITEETAVEKAERVSLLRFLAEFKKVKIIDVAKESWSIDTAMDYEKTKAMEITHYRTR